MHLSANFLVGTFLVASVSVFSLAQEAGRVAKGDHIATVKSGIQATDNELFTPSPLAQANSCQVTASKVEFGVSKHAVNTKGTGAQGGNRVAGGPIKGTLIKVGTDKGGDVVAQGKSAKFEEDCQGASQALLKMEQSAEISAEWDRAINACDVSAAGQVLSRLAFNNSPAGVQLEISRCDGKLTHADAGRTPSKKGKWILVRNGGSDGVYAVYVDR
jgi:hypothetical protein